MFQTCVFNQYVQGKETPLHFNLFFKLMITNIKTKIIYYIIKVSIFIL